MTVDYRLLPSLLPTSLQKKIIKFYRGVKFFYIFAARMEKYLSYNMFDNCAGPLVGTVTTAITPPRPSENGTSRHITVGRAAIATPP